MTTFYGIQVGALETQEFRQQPIPFWLVCFSDSVTGPLRQLFFAVVLPDGTVVEPEAVMGRGFRFGVLGPVPVTRYLATSRLLTACQHADCDKRALQRSGLQSLAS
jgi:hypothetical protein